MFGKTTLFDFHLLIDDILPELNLPVAWGFHIVGYDCLCIMKIDMSVVTRAM